MRREDRSDGLVKGEPRDDFEGRILKRRIRQAERRDLRLKRSGQQVKTNLNPIFGGKMARHRPLQIQIGPDKVSGRTALRRYLGRARQCGPTVRRVSPPDLFIAENRTTSDTSL